MDWSYVFHALSHPFTGNQFLNELQWLDKDKATWGLSQYKDAVLPV